MSGKPAARVSDPTVCPIPGHGSNPIVAGSPDVLFDSLPAARMGDPTGCGSTLASAVIPNVLINNLPATTVGTLGSHGNTVVAGSGTVIIGNAHSPAAFVSPKELVIANHSQCILIEDQDGNPLQGIPYRLRNPQGEWTEGYTDSAGRSQRVFGNAGDSIDFFTAVLEKLA